jgi:hypothetical protein
MSMTRSIGLIRVVAGSPCRWRRLRLHSRVFFVGVVAVLVTSGCGAALARVSPASPVVGADMQILAPSAVPGLPSTTSALTVAELAKDAPIPNLASMITRWGYLDGRQRIFQGESRHLTLVVSRFIVFKDAAGAHSFVAFIQANAAAFFGGSVGEAPLVAQGRSGWMFAPAACGCHMASPDISGILPVGSSVIWLEINGPDATSSLLVTLLDPALSVPAAP